MRIDGTHQFNAPIERVYAALINPDTLRAVLPGCERVTQLGPADDDGRLHGEARVAFESDGVPHTFTWSIDPTRVPRHLKYEARVTSPESPVTISGFIDLVAREGQTVAAYVWEVSDTTRATTTAGAALLKRVGNALDAQIAASDQLHATLEDALPILRADSARGRITLLPSEPSAEPVMTRLRPSLNGGLWMAAGIVVGAALLVGLAATLSLLRNRNASATR